MNYQVVSLLRIQKAFIEVQGTVFGVQNIEDDDVQIIFHKLETGSKLYIKWLGTLEVMYMQYNPCEDKIIVYAYCDKVFK